MLGVVMVYRCHNWVGETNQTVKTTVIYFLWFPLPLLFEQIFDGVNAAFDRDQADLCLAEVVYQETP